MKVRNGATVALVAATLLGVCCVAVPRPRNGAKESNAAPQGNLLKKAEWVDRGFASPGATVETYFWAGREGNLERMRECMSPSDGTAFEELLKAKSPQETLRSTEAAWSNLGSYEISSKRDVSPSHVEFEISTHGKDWGDTPEKMTLRKYGLEWKIDDMRKQAEENSRNRNANQTMGHNR